MMADLAFRRLYSRIFPVIFGLVHRWGASRRTWNHLLNSRLMLSLRRIAIFLIGRWINTCNFKCSRNELLTAASDRTLVSLMLRVRSRYPTARRGPNWWLLAHQGELPLVVILWRAVLSCVGSCRCWIQFWILIYAWSYLAGSSQRVIEVWEIRLVKTIYSMLWYLLLTLRLAWGTIYIRWRCCLVGMLNSRKITFICFRSIILWCEKNLHGFLICESPGMLWSFSRLSSRLLMREMCRILLLQLIYFSLKLQLITLLRRYVLWLIQI